MAPKNPKAAALEKKAANEAAKSAKQKAADEAAEAASWSRGAKDSSKEAQLEAKRLEALAKKAE
eukprot:jgi/Hompol1/5450/HPOL_001701-RA